MSNPSRKLRRKYDKGYVRFVGPRENTTNSNLLGVGKMLARREATGQEDNILELTPTAVAAIRTLIAKAGDKDILGIRIAACGGGCAGLSYQMGLEADVREGDAIVRCDDVTIFVDEESRPLLQGTCIDFCADPTGFLFDNPNNCGACGNRKGCGL